jgi:hypothetical protein
MKKVFLLFLTSIVMGINAAAQSELSSSPTSSQDNIEYFFDVGKLSMFAGPYTRMRFINNTMVTGMGGGGVFCWEQRYYIYGQMTSYSCDVPKNTDKKMELENYGATVGYIFSPYRKIHFTAGVQFASNNILFRKNNGLKIDDDITFFSLAPEINVEANILKYLRIYVGAGWHFAFTGDDYFDLNRKTLSGFSINFGFLMGKF